MYLSLDQITRSLKSIEGVHPFFGVSFLAFKSAEIPVGSTKGINFASVAREVLNRYYRPSVDLPGYYLPFAIGSRDRWKKPRYFHTTIQRITSDTFSDVMLHEKDSSEWGWRVNYIQAMQSHLPRACYALSGQFASRANMMNANAAMCIPLSVDARRS
jgi:hypothetical protein